MIAVRIEPCDCIFSEIFPHIKDLHMFKSDNEVEDDLIAGS